MILQVTEQNGITIVEFINMTRFTLASADEVKTELRPLLNNKDCRMLFDFHDIEFVDSSDWKQKMQIHALLAGIPQLGNSSRS